jgi:hypothetical protein
MLSGGIGQQMRPQVSIPGAHRSIDPQPQQAPRRLIRPVVEAGPRRPRRDRPHRAAPYRRRPTGSATLAASSIATAHRSTTFANWLVRPPPKRRSSTVKNSPSCSNCAASATCIGAGATGRPVESTNLANGSPNCPPTANAPTAALNASRRISLNCPGRQVIPRRPTTPSRCAATAAAASASDTPVTFSYAARIAGVTGRPCSPRSTLLKCP